MAGEEQYRLLEDPDGQSGFELIAELPAGSTTHTLEAFLPARLNARYLLQACNSSGCSDSNVAFVSLDLPAQAVGYFKASNTSAGDRFGAVLAVSADGRTLAVGAAGEDGTSGNPAGDTVPDSGAVYVFTREASGSWKQEAYLKASNAEISDWFGYALALSRDGNTLAVSAIFEDAATGAGESDNSLPASGAVYVFTRNNGAWQQQAYLKAGDADREDRFGSSLALSDDGQTLAVGAASAQGIDQNGDPVPAAGAVYVFSRTGNTWQQTALLTAAEVDAGDNFGASLALSGDGDRLAVGVPGDDSKATGINGDPGDEERRNSGAVYLFLRGASGWTQEAYLKASNAGADDYFGNAVALSREGDRLVVGAMAEGSASHSIDGDQDNDFAPASGAVYLFERDASNTWSQRHYFKASNAGAGDEFGSAVALSGDGRLLAVAARSESSAGTGFDANPRNNDAPGSGAAYVFQQGSDGIWRQLAYVKAPDTAADDRFGAALAVADGADGTALLAVGANGEESAATGIGGDANDTGAPDAGAVYLY